MNQELIERYCQREFIAHKTKDELIAIGEALGAVMAHDMTKEQLISRVMMIASMSLKKNS
jgi:hypothetical protein